ncbi:hypothetical protein MAHJHV63_08260 [Mycobacterium avium subsp. hominissuis]
MAATEATTRPGDDRHPSLYSGHVSILMVNRSSRVYGFAMGTARLPSDRVTVKHLVVHMILVVNNNYTILCRVLAIVVLWAAKDGGPASERCA